jgi:hypothetical protein
MNVKISDINEVVEALSKFYDISVDIGNTLFRVYTDSSKGINEFESRLVAAGEAADVDVAVFLNEMVNFVDHRDQFEPLVRGNFTGTWVARYTNLTFTDQD